MLRKLHRHAQANVAHHWRRASYVRYATETESRRPVHEPGWAVPWMCVSWSAIPSLASIPCRFAPRAVVETAVACRPADEFLAKAERSETLRAAAPQREPSADENRIQDQKAERSSTNRSRKAGW